MRPKSKKPTARPRRSTSDPEPPMKISRRLATAMKKLQKVQEKARKADKASQKERASMARLFRRWAREE